MAYSAISDAELAVNKPITTSLMFRMRDNPEAIFAQLGWLVTAGVFVSPQQTITAGGTLTLNHGLTIASANITKATLDYFLVCTSSEFGYTAGQTVQIAAESYFPSAGSAAQGLTTIITTSQLLIQYGLKAGVFQVARRNATVGNIVDITAANWNLVVVLRG